MEILNLGAITTVALGCDEKNTQSNFITQRLLAYKLISLPRVKNGENKLQSIKNFSLTEI
ncbi:hypothetical protein [Nostoc sp. FACHB-110]|uniref:hypothetical protein n=1 Tax=Nostoc sp. FACHB-110 TaxID=2692834 RepID=UPI001686602A|nr:hypothetical protein [Nostoc sp. FACHB-110]MBD2438813.1 hypothetical protein [Nostoc sp. FACHB-110]